MEERLIDAQSPFDDIDSIKQLIPKNTNLPVLYQEPANLSLVKKSNNELIEEIHRTDLITEEDANNIKKAQTFLLTSYKDVPIYNSRIVKVASILNDAKFPTNDAKFWQCKMQAETHYTEFVRNMQKIDRVKIDIEEINYQIRVLEEIIKSKDPSDLSAIKLTFDKRRLENKLSQYLFEMKLLEKDIKQRLREINDWVEISIVYENGCQFSKNDYNEHTYMAHLLSLNTKYAEEKDQKNKEMIKGQLNTICKLLGIEPIK